jgi:hypothetical protein
MIKIINKVVKAPLKYIADLQSLTFKQYLLLHTNFSPSYPIMIFTSLITTLMLCAFVIYYISTDPDNTQCFNNIHGATYIIVIMYPIETILFFICITGSIALSKGNCWKLVLILIFGPLLCGFGFG